MNDLVIVQSLKLALISLQDSIYKIKKAEGLTMVMARDDDHHTYTCYASIKNLIPLVLKYQQQSIE